MSTSEALLERLRKLSPPDRLRAAAELLEAQRPRLALALAKGVVTELELLHMMGKLSPAEPQP